MEFRSATPATRPTTSFASSPTSSSIHYKASTCSPFAISIPCLLKFSIACNNVNESENQLMLILSRDDMRRALDAAELFEALTQGFQMLADGKWKLPLRAAIEMPAHQGVSLFMPAYCEA